MSDNFTFKSIAYIQASSLNIDMNENDAYILSSILNAIDENDEENVIKRISKRWGYKIDFIFLFLSHDQLLYSYIDWVLDKSIMK